MALFIELVKGVALLLALCFLYGLNVRYWRGNALAGQMVSGLIFGSICVIGMLTPVTLAPGLIFDARSVVLAMASLFGGPVVAAVAAVMAVVGRLSLGGVGAMVTVQVIGWSVLAGLVYRQLRARGWVGVSAVALAVFGLLVHVGILVVWQQLPAAAVRAINDVIAWPFILTFTVATVVLGLLLRDVEERQTTEQALRRTAARLLAITQAMPDLLLVINDEGRYVEILPSNSALLAASVPSPAGLHLHDVLPAALADQQMALLRKTLDTGHSYSCEYELETRSGLRYFEGRTQRMETTEGERPAVVFMARDITERKQSESALRESELRFRTILRNIPSISVQGYQADGTTTYWNKASERLYGYTAKEALGANLLELIIPEAMHEGVRREMQRMFTTGEAMPEGELQLRRKDGTLVEVFSSHTLIQVPGQPPEMFCIDIDISARKAAEEEAKRLAFYDPLTQLPNRRLLTERLRQALESGEQAGLITAVLFVDLDNFKTLNDTQGHEVGDLLLQKTAQRLCAVVRAQDTVARLGGDEFVIVLQRLGSGMQEAGAQARALGERFLHCLREPYALGEQLYHSAASIGVTLLERMPISIDEVLKQADMAMYRAKASGRNTLRFFGPDMQQAVNRRALLEAELRNGLSEQQLLLFYQPQVDSIGRVTGAEVLVRWRHPEQGMVSPAEFIPLAEESGLILPLGHWVMETALRQQARWRSTPALRHLTLSINVSARQFLQEDFVAQVVALLQNTGADSDRIKLELTESLLLHNMDAAIATMHALQAHGLGFSLDDFGTGYSSLSYLKRLPLEQLKIDQGFVRDVLQDPRDAAIARTIITLAGSLGLSVIAEGVETDAHHQFLLAHGCTAFQGYLFGRPMELQAFEQQMLA